MAGEMNQSLDMWETSTLLTYVMAFHPEVNFTPSVLSKAYRPPALLPHSR
jgi:hypothetical protein